MLRQLLQNCLRLLRDRAPERADLAGRQFAYDAHSVPGYLFGDRCRDVRRGFEALRERNKREARGQKLLREWLSPEQLAQYAANGYFDVTGCHSGKRYRIRMGTAMNVHEIDRFDRPQVGWCFVPKGSLVTGDVMLAQKIALETDERAALAVAKTFLPQTRSNHFLHY
jgi:hypothetical protein